MNSAIHILIADDDSDDAAFLAEGISHIITCVKIGTAKNGLNCLSYLNENEAPELIFLDINMPCKGGLECLEAIKNDSRFEQTDVVMCSTSKNDKDIEAAFALKATKYIVKPVALRALVEMLQQLFTSLGNRAKTGGRENFVLSEKKRPSSKSGSLAYYYL